jgi:hypothetical protein
MAFDIAKPEGLRFIAKAPFWQGSCNYGGSVEKLMGQWQNQKTGDFSDHGTIIGYRTLTFKLISGRQSCPAPG